MHAVFDLGTLVLEERGQCGDGVLRVGDRHAIPRHDDNMLGVAQHLGGACAWTEVWAGCGSKALVRGTWGALRHGGGWLAACDDGRPTGGGGRVGGGGKP
eukprot:366150-Chlamydomonas_euryale.AAC.2